MKYLKIILTVIVVFSFLKSKSQVDSSLFTTWTLISVEKDSNSYILPHKLTVRFKPNNFSYYSQIDSLKKTDCGGNVTYTKDSIITQVTACHKHSYLPWPSLYKNPDKVFAGSYLIQGNTLTISNKGLKYSLVKQ